MLRLCCALLLCNTFIIHPIFAQNQTLHIRTSVAANSVRFLGLQNNLRSSDKGISKLDIEYDTDNLLSQISLNYDGYDNFNLDRSYLQYSSGIATFGVGAIERNWSFSDKTSLILSHNASPFKSVYLNLENEFKYNWMPSKAYWTLEAFNGLTKGSLKNGESMLLGIRAILSPIEGLDFELVQTSQWGGKGYNNGISALGSALLFDTNNSSNSNTNKMAGFGISYLIPSNLFPLRIYGQTIGEDDAGNLPSCYAYLAGLEWTNTKIKYPTILSIEAINTRIDKTTNGYCGPNTMYNNNTYDYTNNGTSMGAEIDSEGTSLGLYVKSQLSQEINIEYATKSVVINDNNWSGHRLSSKRQSGLINSIGISWIKKDFSLKGNIYNQDFSLNKANINKSYGIGFTSSIEF